MEDLRVDGLFSGAILPQSEPGASLYTSFYRLPKATLDTGRARVLLCSSLQGQASSLWGLAASGGHLQLPAALWQLPGCLGQLPRACSQGDVPVSGLSPGDVQTSGARAIGSRPQAACGSYVGLLPWCFAFALDLASFLSACCEFQLWGVKLNKSTATAHLLRLQKWGSAAPGR